MRGHPFPSPSLYEAIAAHKCVLCGFKTTQLAFWGLQVVKFVVCNIQRVNKNPCNFTVFCSSNGTRMFTMAKLPIDLSP